MVNPPLSLLLQEHLESMAGEFAESEVMRRKVGSRVMHCLATWVTLMLQRPYRPGHMLLRMLYCVFGSSSHQSHFATLLTLRKSDTWPGVMSVCFGFE